MPKSLYSAEAAVLRRRLRAVREQFGVTQVALSDALGRSQTFISDVERGIRRLDLVELWQYCGALGIDLTEFVSDFQSEIETGKSRRHKVVRADPARRPRKRS